MNELVDLREKPLAEEIYIIAGWQQWADAGAVSSGLPPYLIEHTHARQNWVHQIGRFLSVSSAWRAAFVSPRDQDGRWLSQNVELSKK